jgi:NTP pyrophosphatase (non-canonical NTP hydrolase)
MENFTYTEKEDIFDFMYFLAVNEDLYNNVLNNFNYKNYMKLTEKKDQYIRNIYLLYIIESIIEDVEIINNKENINIKDNKDGLKDEVTYAIIYSQKLKPFDDENNINKKNQFF